MIDYADPEWIDLEKGEVVELEGGEYGWSDQGSVYAYLENCIALTAYDPDSGIGGVKHLVAESLEPEEVTKSILNMWHDSEAFGNPEQFNWYAAGGYLGEANYTEPKKSTAVEDSDKAYLRRIHTDQFFDQMNASYESEWLDENERMAALLDLDEGEFNVGKMD